MAIRLAHSRLSGHETFVCRYAWLPKVVREISEQENLGLFGDTDEAMVRLGVGKNMVKSIRFWAESAQVIQPSEGGHSLTLFGQRILGHDGSDPYLEHPETLWLLHWAIATNRVFPNYFWVQMLNHWHRGEFTGSNALTFLKNGLSNDANKSETTLLKGLQVFVNSYVPRRGRKGDLAEEHLDCPLVELGLIRESLPSREPVYSFNLDDKPSISSELFAYCLNEFWSAEHPDADHLSFSAISTGVGSPGQVFKLPELAVRSRLEQLSTATKGRLDYVESAALQQVVRRQSESLAIELLDNIYLH